MRSNASFCNGSLANISALNGSLHYGHNQSGCNIPNPIVQAEAAWMMSEEIKVLLYVVYSLIFLIGTSGNLMVLYSVGFKKRRHTSNDIFLLFLAFVDFVGSIFVPMVMISDMVSGFSEWYYGEIGCTILPSISPVTMAASSWMLVAIAVDRYRMIKSPLKARPKLWMTFVSVFFLFGCAVASSAKYSMALKLVDGLCWDIYETTRDQRDTNLIFTIFNWPIPFVIMMLVYVLSGIELQKSLKVHANNAAITQRIRQNKRIVRMFAIVVTLFFFLTTPYACFMVIYNVMNDSYPEKIHMPSMLSANYSLTCITAINSCVNPIIYAKMHNEVRKQFYRFFSPLCGAWFACCRETKPSSSKAYVVGGSSTSLAGRSSMSGTRSSVLE